MSKRPRSTFKIVVICLLGMGLIGFLGLRHLASGPDRTLVFERRIESPLTAAQLDSYLGDVSLWPDWFYSTGSAQIVGDETRRKIRTGDQVSIGIDPKKGNWKKFRILAEVLAYEPGRSLKLKVIEDSKGRLRALFDDLIWEVRVEPSADGKKSTIVAHASGLTRNWRSRLFGKLTERILMAQVTYPNVIALSEKGTGIDHAGSGLFPN